MRASRMPVVAGAVLALMLTALTGCSGDVEEPLRVPTGTGGEIATGSPSAEPSVLPSPGADPEADVAAAIAVYEAYVAASNEVVIGDEATWAGVLDLVTGSYLEGTQKSLEDMRDGGRNFAGEAVVASSVVAGQDAARVVLDVCLDVSQTDVLGPDGKSVIDPDREQMSALRVRVIPTGEVPIDWKIDYMILREEGPPC